MLKIGILEDEPEQCEKLLEFLHLYEQKYPDFSCSTDVFDTANKLLFNYRPGFDILFMDIRLPDMLGIDAARQIRKTDEDVLIIFVTNLSQYAIDGYSVNAFDYILKPLLYGAFETKLERICHVLAHRRTRTYLTLHTKQETYRLEVDTIVYIEVSGHDLVFHTEKGDCQVWGTLSRYEQELPADYFSRCNACYLVNLKYVRGVRGGIVDLGCASLAVSRNRNKSFLSDLAKYKGGSV